MSDNTDAPAPRPTPIHGTVAVRAGEEIDAGRLRDWLAKASPIDVPAGSMLSVRQFPAGFSNLTYLVTVHDEHGGRALVLRRPPHGVAPGVAHDMPREHGILSALHPLGVPVPRPVAVCTDASVIGAPFYLMEHVEGVIVRDTLPAPTSRDTDGVARLRALSQTVVDTLAQLHAVPVAGTALAQLGRPDGYVQRQVDGWTRRWYAARTTPVASVERVAAWLAAHCPTESGVALIHNDFKLDNLVLSPDASRVRAILDWEMATVGDPLMDLGSTLAYWVEAGDAPVFRALGGGVTSMPGAYTRAEFAAAYADARGIRATQLRFYEAFGVFKVAVIAQQILARYEQGFTRDPRFIALGEVIDAMGARGENLAYGSG